MSKNLISTINSFKEVNGQSVPIEGELLYRGISVETLVAGFEKDNRYGYEETVYLLLFGELPNEVQLKEFSDLLVHYRKLPTNFVRDVIMKAPNKDIMNSLARSVLTLYSYDKNANDTSIPNVLRQCIQLIANFPVLSVYAYQAYRHYGLKKSLYIHNPDPKLSTAENILRLLRPNKKYTQLEAKCVDVFGYLHSEEANQAFDVIILDPPAFSKSKDSLKKAYRGYKEINMTAMKIIKEGGYLLTFSCSQHMTPDLFMQMINEAAHDAKRTVQFLDFRIQAPDHPALLQSEEQLYLKCIILRVK